VMALKKVELFRPLDDAELDHLADTLVPAPFTRGEILTKQGAEAHWLYIIVEGEVAVRISKDGHETEVARMGEGSFFGEMSLMTGEPRSATVVALTDVECFRLDQTSFKELVQNRPEIARPMAAILAERRANLARVQGDLDAEARMKRIATDGDALFTRMRSFLGL
jgi:CRP-like cAMP-binding protein